MQKDRVVRVLEGGPQSLLLCEHPKVITLGRLSKEQNLYLTKEQAVLKNIEIRPIDRGGDVTLHAPGQLVIYPILNLTNLGRDLKSYMARLEQVAIDLLNDFGILAHRFDGRTGVWVDKEKIVSIGIGVKKWISYHGMGINVNTDLNLFSHINPCGLNATMTSIQKIKNQKIDMNLVKKRVINHFQRIFELGDIVANSFKS